MAQYNPLYGEGVFDVAAKLYKETSSGVSDLLALNAIDLDADLFGTTLIYTEGLEPLKTVIVTIPKPIIKEIFLTRKDQTVFDLAVQLYGNVSKIGSLLQAFPNLNGEIPLNTSIDIIEQSDPIVKYFKDRNLIPSTGFTYVAPAIEQATFDSSIITIDSTLYTFDQT